MRRCRTILIVLLSSWLYAGTACAQVIVNVNDSTAYRNAITISLLPLFDGTYSLTYARRLKNGNEITFNPRVRRARYDNEADNQLGPFVFKDPYWVYNSYAIRSGLVLYLNHGFAYEPQLQFSYASFSDRAMVINDYKGGNSDASIRMDRSYFSPGIINTVSLTGGSRWFRAKGFIGFGFHVRRYWETQYGTVRFDTAVDFPEPVKSSYFGHAFTLHAGVEFGFNF